MICLRLQSCHGSSCELPYLPSQALTSPLGSIPTSQKPPIQWVKQYLLLLIFLSCHIWGFYHPSRITFSLNCIRLPASFLISPGGGKVAMNNQELSTWVWIMLKWSHVYFYENEKMLNELCHQAIMKIFLLSVPFTLNSHGFEFLCWWARLLRNNASYSGFFFFFSFCRVDGVSRNSLNCNLNFWGE